MNTWARLATLRRRLVHEQVDGIVVTAVSDMRYLTGFSGVFDSGFHEVADGACLVTRHNAWFVTDFRYKESAERAAQDSGWKVRIRTGSLYDELCDEARIEGAELLAVQSSIPHGSFEALSRRVEGEIVAVRGWVAEQRRVKEPAEIDRIQEAAKLGDLAFEHVMGMLRPGLTEIEVALELEFFMRRNGSEGVAFPPIVASGPNSAIPHASVTDRLLSEGDFVKLDFGAVIDGYRSDMTRTVVLGSASARQREVHDAVAEANEAALSVVGPGVAGKDADAAAREVLERHGFGERFGHGLGHGVGLDIHESPSLGPRSDDVLQVGDVVTVEPGVYLEGFGGVRIEDLVVVEDGGLRLLTTSPKTLIEL